MQVKNNVFKFLIIKNAREIPPPLLGHWGRYHGPRLRLLYSKNPKIFSGSWEPGAPGA